MPLLPGKENIGKNIAELDSSGKRSHKQDVAIALHEAYDKGHEHRKAEREQHEKHKYGRGHKG